MKDIMQPFQVTMNMQSGVISPSAPIIMRKLSDMRAMYADKAAVEAIMAAEGDRLIYEVYPPNLPEEEGQVLYCTTVIHPGKIGDEYHMTKGHFHARRDRGEVYVGMAGEGYLLLMTETGQMHAEPMTQGTIAYVPPYWAHRTVNVGDVPFIFFAAWPGDAGHDYGSIEESGFAQILVERADGPTLVDHA